MLNHMLDGTGRFSNRYTTVMPCRLSARFSSFLQEGGSGVSLLGEPAEMIEIPSAREDHLNVHRVQTSRVLEIPGENPDLPPERRLGLRDLRVRVDGPLPVLVDRLGKRLVPIFLGARSLVAMPTLVRFLSRFGIGEFRLLHPARPSQRQAGVVSFKRLRIGNLVLRRRMWTFSPAVIFDGYAHLSDAELFLKVNRWRMEHGIPEQVFVAERLQAKFNLWPLHKPQYIDFTSPLFIPVLRAAFESCENELRMEEMLPTREAFPVGEDGQQWAVEAQLESIAFQGTVPWKGRISQFPEGSSQWWRADSQRPSQWLKGDSNV
jgi:hypothetical protein